ncbi:hypothetical protein VNO77_27132 [Canavalia gladiata]|uniref:Uncharacterized protein n=1 Tax=Canavalia gladiata TaxID=3824 RepID=A0AAN9KXA4_CANGL
MGDILGSPRLAPPPFGVSRACSFGGAHAQVKRAWAKVALGWVTSLEVLVLHLLLLASVGLVLLVARTRKVSIAQILLGGGGRAFQRRLPGLEIHPRKNVRIVSSARGGLAKA